MSVASSTIIANIDSFIKSTRPACISSPMTFTAAVALVLAHFSLRATAESGHNCCTSGVRSHGTSISSAWKFILHARWPRCTVAACLKTLEAPKMRFIVNFGQFSDRFLFGPVFGQKSQNRTLSEKSDGLAALSMTRVSGENVCNTAVGWIEQKKPFTSMSTGCLRTQSTGFALWL